jgi:hypothetical protein
MTFAAIAWQSMTSAKRDFRQLGACSFEQCRHRISDRGMNADAGMVMVHATPVVHGAASSGRSDHQNAFAIKVQPASHKNLKIVNEGLDKSPSFDSNRTDSERCGTSFR